MDTEKIIEEFNQATQELRTSGSDLGRIKIVLKKDAIASYWTRRIVEEMSDESQDCSFDRNIP